MAGSNWKRPSAPADEVTVGSKSDSVWATAANSVHGTPQLLAADACWNRARRAAGMVELATDDGSSLATAGAPPATAHATTRQRPTMTAATFPNRAHPDTVSTGPAFTSRTRHR